MQIAAASYVAQLSAMEFTFPPTLTSLSLTQAGIWALSHMLFALDDVRRFGNR